MHPFPEPLHRCSLVTVSALADSVPALHRDSTGLFLKEPTHKLSQEGQCPVSLPSLWNANRGPHTAQESPGHHPAAVRTQGLPCEPQPKARDSLRMRVPPFILEDIWLTVRKRHCSWGCRSHFWGNVWESTQWAEHEWQLEERGCTSLFIWLISALDFLSNVSLCDHFRGVLYM